MRVEAASLNARTVAVLAHCYFILPESAMSKIVIVYHSGYGHTKKVAEAVLAGTLEAGAALFRTCGAVRAKLHQSERNLLASAGICHVTGHADVTFSAHRRFFTPFCTSAAIKS